MRHEGLPFWRDVGIVLSGAAAAQVIPVIGSLLLARLFVPAEFGHFAAWLSLASLFAVALTGRYEMALVLEETSEGRRTGAVATLVVAGVATTLLTSCCAVFVLASGLQRPAGLSMFMLALLAPTALLVASAQVWQSWAASESRFSELSAMRIVPAGSITALQIMAGLVSPSAESLAVAHAIGVAVGVLISARILPLHRIQTRSLREFWRRHADFPTWSLPAGLISTGAAQLPVLVVAGRFGAEAAGLLALALRTLGAPTALLGASVLDVFKVAAARDFRDLGQCRDYYVRTLKGLAVGSIAVSVPILLLGEDLFAVAFGELWRGAGAVAVWLIPMFALRFVASPLSYMFFIARRQRTDLVWQVCLLGMTLASLFGATSYPAALQSYSAGYSALYVIYLWMSYRLSCGVPR